MRLGKFITLLLLICFEPALSEAGDLNSMVELKLSYLAFPGTSNSVSPNQLEFDAKYLLDYKSKRWTYKLDLKAYFVSYPDYQFTLPEAYVSYGGDESKITLGRKMPEMPLFIDRIWGLGVDQAFSRVHPFMPEAQGRLGLSYVLNTDSVILELFFSPLSVPDQAPSLQVSKSGQVSSKNPWSKLPPRSLIVDGNQFDLNYQLHNDSIPNLLVYNQYGVSFGVLTDYIEVNAMYLNKPTKQLSLILDPSLDLENVGQVNVGAEPDYSREHVFGVQILSELLDNLELSNGFYGMAVQSSQVDSNVKYRTSLGDYFFASTGLQFTGRRYSALLAHLFQRNRPFDQEGVYYIDQRRFLHSDAIKLAGGYLWNSRLKLSSSFLYGLKDKGFNFNFLADYRLSDKLNVFFSLNLIKSFSEQFSNDSFYSFSDLDGLRVGAQYVF